MRSYLDILTELKDTIDDDDLIPKAVKEDIESLLENLFNILWKYSD